MTYYGMFLNLYECNDCFDFDYSRLITLLGVDNSSIDFDTDINIIGFLDEFVEQGFNEGFKFAVKIFLGNL